MKSDTHTPDLELLEEMSLAMAQAEMQIAMDESGLKPSKLAEKLGRHKSFISRILSGNHNLTIRTMARVFGACGFEMRFSKTPISVNSRVTWVNEIQCHREEHSKRPGDAPSYVIAEIAHLGTSLGQSTLAF